MGRSGTQGFEFRFGKNWNFNLSNFCIVITRPRPLKICQSVRVLNTHPRSRSNVRGRRTPPTVCGRRTLDRARRTSGVRASRSVYIAKCTKTIWNVVHFNEKKFAKSIDNKAKQAYNKGIETKRGTTPERGIHYDQPDHAQDHDRPLQRAGIHPQLYFWLYGSRHCLCRYH